MDFRFLCMMQLLVVIQLFCFLCSNGVQGIVNQELILTPKQGLQLSGKRIYYEDQIPANTSMLTNTTTTRAWERALRHVTYLTLFTSSADGIITGNFSKVKAYVDFLNSPYIPSMEPPDVRFGDIVTLARGKLLNMKNGSYIFIEDFCMENCPLQNVTALWQVQKIRHRDFQKNYYYEIKFSISPLESIKTANYQMHNSYNPHRLHSFIQRQEDYPNSFKGLSNTYDDDKIVRRRIDSERSFRPIQKHNFHSMDSMVPLPQPTFLRNILLPPPPPPPPEQLNIGEYYKGVHLPTSISKTFPYSNLVYAFLGRDTNSFPNPITKAPRPANYHPQYHNKFVEYQQSYEPLITKHQPPEIITHHFHHYFYMPPNALDSFTPSTTASSTSTTSTTNKPITPLNGHPENDNIADGFQHDYFDIPAANYYTATTPNYNNNYEVKLSTISEYQPMYPMNQIEKGQLVRLAHIEPLKQPDIQPYQYTTSQLPLFIFPAAVEEEIDEHPSDKPFIQSEQLPPDTNYYSEPDPLYINNANANENNNAAVNPNVLKDEINYSTTPLAILEQLENTNNRQNLNTDNHLDNSVTTEYYLENQEFDSKTEARLSTNPSEQPYNLLQSSNSSYENLSRNTYNNDNTDSPTQTTLAAHTSALRYETKPTIHGTSRISVQSHNGITNQNHTAYSKNSRFRNPLKEMLTNETIYTSTPRYRNIQKRFKPIAVTTEKPVVKWKLRRTSATSTTSRPLNNEMFVTNRNAISPNRNSEGNQRTQVAATNNDTEKYEVLTQKSISKSVSIKVGYNGEEIPILVEEDRNNN